MNTKKLIEVETALQPLVERLGYQDEFRMDAYLSVDHLLDGVQALLNLGWRHLAAITGQDLPVPGPAAAGAPAAEHPGPVEDQPPDAPAEAAEGRVELMYHFCHGNEIATLRTSVPYSRPVAPSVCGLIPYATLYERELIEMFGVTLEGTPETSRLLLPDDWPDGVYPLRKAFQG